MCVLQIAKSYNETDQAPFCFTVYFRIFVSSLHVIEKNKNNPINTLSRKNKLKEDKPAVA
jgi:hypothetical protein